MEQHLAQFSSVVSLKLLRLVFIASISPLCVHGKNVYLMWAWPSIRERKCPTKVWYGWLLATRMAALNQSGYFFLIAGVLKHHSWILELKWVLMGKSVASRGWFEMSGLFLWAQHVISFMKPFWDLKSEHLGKPETHVEGSRTQAQPWCFTLVYKLYSPVEFRNDSI